ncbi:GntR family transcriptional regulator [uncultured Sphaerochaeta sp.]|uniref:GntR family transcriptional regulator n=1 Tax=uncultured Sphaerochaeta sp. TaxID=886478 RepID=UPI002AA6E0B7|nr:GntR family transcriptional regulator [uncultured Sphaerochaeta sp.]
MYTNKREITESMNIDINAIFETDQNDPSLTSAERTYRIILQKIITGEFPPGMRLTRRPLAKMLGVSHIPILEAMKKLEQDGVIEYHPHWGSIVTIPTVERIKDIFLLREAVECQIARILAQNLSKEQQFMLQRAANDLDRIPFENADPYKYTEMHYKFHLMLAEAANSASLYRALERNSFLWLVLLQGQTKRPRTPESLNRHILLVDSIIKKDIQTAEEAMRQHVRFGQEGLIKDFSEGQE